MSTSSKTSLNGFKVVLLGDRNAGKTCIMRRYFKNEYNGNEVATISGGYDSRVFIVDGKEYRMGVWDTSGEERFESVTRLFYRNADAAILCYDVTKLKTFHRLNYWMTEIRISEPQCSIYLCGTKIDLLRDYEATPKISFVESYARENGVKFLMTSSKYGNNIDELFNEIVEDYVSNSKNSSETPGTIKLPTSRFLRNQQKKKKKCCANG